MRSNNPVLTKLPEQSHQAQQSAYNGYDAFTPASAQPQSAERPMTVDDVVIKTGMTLAVIIAVGVATFLLALSNPAFLMLTFVGAIGAFVTVLIHSFKGGGAVLTMVYAVFEGMLVGGLSLSLSGALEGGPNAGVLIGQAILGTVGVFIGMLVVYKTGTIRVTPKFTRFLTGAIVGVAVLALGNLLLAVFGVANPLRDGGMLSIIFSLVCIVLAALSFLQDFDIADRLVRAGAPAKMAWSVALGLAVTLVWLYTEILRVLSYFNRN